MRIALYDHKKDTAAKSLETSWAQLCELLTYYRQTPCEPCLTPKHCPEKNGKGWSPVEIAGPRLDENVKWITAAVIDIDHAKWDTVVYVAERLTGLSYVVHSSHSHRPPLDCALRYVIELSEPVHAHDWRAFLAWLIRALDIPADPTCKDLSRFYYLPSIHRGGPTMCGVGEGSPIDVAQVLPLIYKMSGGVAMSAAGPQVLVDKPLPNVKSMDGQAVNLEVVRHKLNKLRARKARGNSVADQERHEILRRVLDGLPLAESGHRDATIHAAMSILACALPPRTPQEVALEIIRPSINAMDCEPEGAAHWLEEAADCYRRRMTKRIERDDDREARDADLKAKLMSLYPAKVREVDAVPVDVVQVPPPEPTKHVAALAAAGISDWRELLLRDSDGNLRKVGENAFVILQYSEETTTSIRFNEFRKTINVTGGPFAGEAPEVLKTSITDYLTRFWNLPMSIQEVKARIARVAYENRFDPLQDYLNSLVWDRVDRLQSLFGRYAGCNGIGKSDNDITHIMRSLGRKWGISAVARGLSPGCQVDTVLVLEGITGKGKTSFCRILGGQFMLETDIELGNKDSMQQCAQAWIVELGELYSLSTTHELRQKNYFTRVTDTFRPPYAEEPVAYPRRCIFIGTTEQDVYLTAKTNRRFWPVRCGDFDLVALANDRDQIWAQAVAEFRTFQALRESGIKDIDNPYRWWLSEDEQRELDGETSARVRESPVDAKVIDWWYGTHPEKRPVRVSGTEVAENVLRLTPDRMTRQVMMEIGEAMRALGFTKTRATHVGVRGQYVYVPSESLRTAPQIHRGHYLALIANAKVQENGI